jgi:hypothetical protein
MSNKTFLVKMHHLDVFVVVGKFLSDFFYVQRNYNVSLQHNKIPEALCELAKQLAKPALPAGVEFQPEAAIVNYFASG